MSGCICVFHVFMCMSFHTSEKTGQSDREKKKQNDTDDVHSVGFWMNKIAARAVDN